MKSIKLLLTALTFIFLYGCSSYSGDSNKESVIDELDLAGTWQHPQDIVFSVNADTVIRHKGYERMVFLQTDNIIDVMTCNILLPFVTYDREDKILKSRGIPITDTDETISFIDYKIFDSQTLFSLDDADRFDKISDELAINSSDLKLEVVGLKELEEQQTTCIQAYFTVLDDEVYRTLEIRVDTEESIYTVSIAYPMEMETGTYEVDASKLTPEGDNVVVVISTDDNEIVEQFGPFIEDAELSILVPASTSDPNVTSPQTLEFTQLDEKQMGGTFDLWFYDKEGNLTNITAEFDFNFLF
ncbi:hypothetical protein [Litoribrevibacter albus]|uniref:Uncharacterized protein n=1 Tax=Litoribrevibacter albus TaxID=1473156 RepID=A0AA37S784_9GAMM|nr:hypothetical protein [Litoribrevibacter albus]GLQ30390.1 hypothetical protein GCM10007876_08680 [Litoribrevibacter albus]